MGFAIFLFLMACLTAVRGYWLFIALALLCCSGGGAYRACRCGTCPKHGAWQGAKFTLLMFALLIPVAVTVLMAGNW